MISLELVLVLKLVRIVWFLLVARWSGLRWCRRGRASQQRVDTPKGDMDHFFSAWYHICVFSFTTWPIFSVGSEGRLT